MTDAKRETAMPAAAASLGRRQFVKAAGLGAVAVGTGIVLPPSASAASHAPTPAPHDGVHPSTTNDVNLYCTVRPVVVDDAGLGKVMITCGNFGPDDATGSVSLKFVTPFFLNVTTLPTVSGATSGWLYRNTAFDVPSIVQVTWANGIAANTTVTVEMDVHLESNCPNVAPAGRAIFTTDAGNTTDIDSDLTRNDPASVLVRPPVPTPSAGNANLAFTATSKPLVAGGAAASVPFNFFNLSGSLLGTLDEAHFTFATPFYCDVPSAGRPSGLTPLYENTVDPAIPSIYQLSVPAGLGRLLGILNDPLTIDIPFQALAGTPAGLMKAMAIIVPTGGDTQGDYSTTFHPYGLMSVPSGAA
jgi:hypothetical protein